MLGGLVLVHVRTLVADATRRIVKRHPVRRAFLTVSPHYGQATETFGQPFSQIKVQLSKVSACEFWPSSATAREGFSTWPCNAVSQGSPLASADACLASRRLCHDVRSRRSGQC